MGGDELRTPEYNPGQIMSYDKWEEKRKHKRFPSDLTVRFREARDEASTEREGTILNVSPGGVFVRSKTPCTPGTELHLLVNVVTPFGEEQEVQADATVMWVSEKPDEEGMGLSFTKIDRHGQYAILACAYRGNE